MLYRVGIDIGGTKINIGILNAENGLLFNRVIPVPRDKGCKSVLDKTACVLKQLCLDNGVTYKDIVSCGIGVPGTVSADGTIVIKVPNLNWENENAAEIFYELTGLHAGIIQDSRAAAFGEYVTGNGQGSKTLICITLGTGIGTGIVVDGEIYNGALQAAGELGHYPAVTNGRACGCGKRGCLECYSAGKGLDQTARELYGDSATAKKLFEMAAGGDEQALQALNQAVEMLGKTLVSAVNLLSPDCLLFSGGLSEQKELYLEPLINYIKENVYHTKGREMKISTAKWGENAPMIGAAIAAKIPVRSRPQLSASIMCADMLNLQSSLNALEAAGIDYIHFDVMDGHFVPNIMIPLMLIEQVARATSIPLDVHLMVENPEAIIQQLTLSKRDIVSVHYESTPHIQRALQLIKDKGAQTALAINPGTPLMVISDLLESTDVLLIMTVNPGFAGQKIVTHSFEKIKNAKEYLKSRGFENIRIETDGNCSFENIPKLYQSSSDIFVVGSSSVFDPKYGIEGAVQKILNSCEVDK